MTSNWKQKLVVALGGNAISPLGKEGTISEQFACSKKTAQLLCEAVEEGYQLVITHGNGPQVGNVLRRSEIASRELYPIPLEFCVADTQAGMGYMIAQSMMNELTVRGKTQHVSTLVTAVEVDTEDPAFQNPTKPIGPVISKADAIAHKENDNWNITEIDKDAYRRVVPSPKPVRILEFPIIKKLVDSGEMIVCGGGGGIPVYRDEQGLYHGAAAVIDKDLSTALLASELDVSTLVILTGANKVYLNFKTPQQQALDQLTIAEAKEYLAQGHFGKGSMAPKVEAAIAFLEWTNQADAQVLIGHLSEFTGTLAGKTGTRIIP